MSVFLFSGHQNKENTGDLWKSKLEDRILGDAVEHSGASKWRITAA
jgi:hypothetical protein